MRRLFILTSALSLVLCGVAALASLRVSFHVNWRGEVVGASNGIALWGHFKVRRRPLSILYGRTPTTGTIPGFDYAGFHYYKSNGLRLIGVPLWLPSCLSAFALFLAIYSWRLRPRPGFCAACGYDLRASPDRCPECGAVPANRDIRRV
jgi:hypothetical protein